MGGFGGDMGPDGGPGPDGSFTPDMGGGGTDGGMNMTECLTSCETDHCGVISDNCGGVITCSECTGEFEVCGLQQPSRCGVPAPVECVPAVPETVCAGVCGVVSDGCEGVFACDGSNGGVVCAPGQQCGGFTGDPNEEGECIDQPACIPRTCGEMNVQCGVVGTGCGDETVDCSQQVGCTGSQVCGTGGQAGQCVEPTTPCVALVPAAACQDTCGIVGNGCGGQIDCEATGNGCPPGETCGGGGAPGQCGSGGSACVPFDAGAVCAGKCGVVSNGCGGVYSCADHGGVVCNANAGESCGGGSNPMPNVCGAQACSPIDMAAACPVVGGFQSCGQVGNGCGGLIQCGACPGTQICGLNAANVCAPEPVCQTIPVATACNGRCGTVPDGCGGSYTCNAGNGGVTCTAPAYCGALAPNQCGNPGTTCVPETCASLGHTCGLAGDGCGGLLNCWPMGTSQCPNPEVQGCVAGQDGAQTCQTGSGGCSGELCDSTPTCDPAMPTRLTGTVVTPGRTGAWTGFRDRVPVPNALVYIPASTGAGVLPTIPTGVIPGNAASCGRCADELLVTGGNSVLAAAVTDSIGNFTLEGRIPVGQAFNLVVKVGKWRRVVQVPAGTSAACATRQLTNEFTRLSAHSTDGLAGTQIPHLAIVTGSVDEMECVFRKIGFAESEFTRPSGAGRIHMYRDNGAYVRENGSNVQTAASVLYDTAGRLNDYDLAVLDCPGSDWTPSSARRNRLQTYADNGGRLFISHWQWRWLRSQTAYSTSADWTNANTSNGGDTNNGYISLQAGQGGERARAGANPVKSIQMRTWLAHVDALNQVSPPRLRIEEYRDVAGRTVGTGTDEWVYRTTTNNVYVQQFSFNTPYDAAPANVCGRIAFSAFHVAATDNSGNAWFPNVCSNAELTPQEKTLVFQLFDLNACTSAGDPPAPPQCTPLDADDLCPSVNDACGLLSDGCGGVVDCGGCAAGSFCDGTTCVAQNCTAQTCSSIGYNCGSAPDGCGGTLVCGTCTGNQVCGLGGPGVCGSSSCTPIPLATACPANSCGTVSDGCGGTHHCGTCENGQVCGGGGANRCGMGSCTPLTFQTACMGGDCGLASDGCGGTYDCGMCVAPQSCGGGGVPNVCGQPPCTPLTQQVACEGLECGWASNGCGGAILCGTCPNGGVCGGAGPNLCGAGCTPTTCETAGAECGTISNLCNGTINCGVCPVGEVCGSGGPNICGSSSCTPRTCEQVGAECGTVGDGCGSPMFCGVCTSPETCGGGGFANQCGIGEGGCNPVSCEQAGVQCGATSDTCGGLLDCGGCDPGDYCYLGSCISFG